jgi:hypothetical protein
MREGRGRRRIRDGSGRGAAGRSIGSVNRSVDRHLHRRHMRASQCICGIMCRSDAPIVDAMVANSSI